MIKISVYNKDVTSNGKPLSIYEFESMYKINIIGGESGTGKTYMFQCIEMALIHQDEWYLESNKEIVVINNVNNIEEQLETQKDKIFICDEDVTHVLLKMNLSKIIAKSKNYFIFIDRSLESFIDTNAKAIFKCIRTGEIIGGIEIRKIQCEVDTIEISNVDSDEFEFMVIEDSESGKSFLTTMLDKLKMYGKPNGRSKVPVNLKEALLHTDKKILIAMDYDTCSAEMLKIIRDDTIDKQRIVFLSMECFEEVLCNSEFLLQAFPEMRDKVINYEKYMDASYKHTGAYFSKLIFDYIKVKSPLKKDGDKNSTKFYTKGMKNFDSCFLSNCCSYGVESCKLYTDIEKRKLLLCNKFESLRQFSTAYDT